MTVIRDRPPRCIARAGVFFVLLAFDCALRGRRHFAAVAAAMAIFSRQTNVVWTLLLLGARRTRASA